MVLGSGIRDPRSGIRDPGSEIRDPGSGKNPFRIPGSKRHRIPDPDPQHCVIFISHSLYLPFLKLRQIFLGLNPGLLQTCRVLKHTNWPAETADHCYASVLLHNSRYWNAYTPKRTYIFYSFPLIGQPILFRIWQTQKILLLSFFIVKPLWKEDRYLTLLLN